MTIQDKQILNKYLNKNGHPNGAKLYHMEKFHPDDYHYFKTRFPDSESFRETIYRIKHGLEQRPKCPVCEKTIEFYDGEFKKHCSAKCSANDKATRDKCKQTCYERYGTDNVFQSTEVIKKIKTTNLERYGETSYTKTDEYKNRVSQTNLEKYGVECTLQAETVKDKIKQTNIERYGVENVSQSKAIKEKKRQSSLEKYGVPCTFQSKSSLEKIKQTNLKKYGVENISQSQFIKSKKLETMKRNRTYGTSKAEEYIFTKLQTKFKEVFRQYKSNTYPFSCDFYIPEINLYIEYQGTWTHGGHPYNSKSETDNETLNRWKNISEVGHLYYNNAIQTWTVKDPVKRKIAKKNKLNWIEFWSIEQFEKWFNTIK